MIYEFIEIKINSEDDIAIEEKHRNVLCKLFKCSEKDLPTYVWENREILQGGIMIPRKEN